MSYPAFDLTGKVAVVIGGTSGIGRAIAHGLAEAGADVVPTSRRVEQVETTAREIQQRGRRSIQITSDVTDRDSLKRVLDGCLDAFGKVDILVNSAGKTRRAASLDFSEEDWNDIIDTNLTGVLRACQIFGRHMLDRKYGRIINIASLSSFVALYEVAAYSASKAASDHLVRAWHHTYGLPTLTTNCSNNYGPYHFPEKLIPLVIIRALRGEKLPVYGSGENVRDWLHVEDHCVALTTLLRHPGIEGETFNIGGAWSSTCCP